MSTAALLRAEGEARGRAETLLELLSIKFTYVPADIETSSVRHRRAS